MAARDDGSNHKGRIVDVRTTPVRAIAAYQAGIIAAWKRDPERGYRLTIAGHRDDYVAVTALPRYLAKLRGAA